MRSKDKTTKPRGVVPRGPGAREKSRDKNNQTPDTKYRRLRTAADCRCAVRLSRRCPTLPQSFLCSTIGSEELNFRVRDGIGCGLLEIATGKLWASNTKRRNSRSDCRR